MINIIKGLFKDSLIYGLSNIIQKLTPFVLIPLITEHLGKTAFKLYDVAFIYTYLFTSLMILGLDSAASVFYFDKKKTNFNKKQVLSYAFLIQVFSALIYLLLFYPVKDQIANALFSNDPGVKSYWLMALYIVPGYIFLNYGLYVLLLQKRKWEYVLISFLLTFLSITGVYTSVVYLNGNMMNVFYILIFSMTISGMLAVFFIRKELIVRVLPVNWPLVRMLLWFGLPFALTSFFRQLIPSVDRFFLIYFHFGSELPQYILASKVASFISVATNAFVLAFTPYSLSKINEENAEKEISDVFSLILIGSFIAVPVLLTFKNVIIEFFADASYQQAGQLFPFFFFGWVFDLFAYFTMLGVYKSHKSVIVFGILITGVLLIVLFNLALVPFFGIFGAALAFFLTKFLLFVATFFYLKKYFKLHIKLPVFISVFIAAIICSYLVYNVSAGIYIPILCLFIAAVFYYIRKSYEISVLKSFFKLPVKL